MFVLSYSNKTDLSLPLTHGLADGEAWSSRWVQSEHEGKTFGKFGLSAGEFFHDEAKDTGELLLFMNSWIFLNCGDFRTMSFPETSVRAQSFKFYTLTFQV